MFTIAAANGFGLLQIIANYVFLSLFYGEKNDSSISYKIWLFTDLTKYQSLKGSWVNQDYSILIWLKFQMQFYTFFIMKIISMTAQWHSLIVGNQSRDYYISAIFKL